MNEKLKDLRHMYEPYLYALGSHLCLDVPPWIPAAGQVDNWQTSAWDTITLTQETSARAGVNTAIFKTLG